MITARVGESGANFQAFITEAANIEITHSQFTPWKCFYFWFCYFLNITSTIAKLLKWTTKTDIINSVLERDSIHTSNFF